MMAMNLKTITSEYDDEDRWEPDDLLEDDYAAKQKSWSSKKDGSSITKVKLPSYKSLFEDEIDDDLDDSDYEIWNGEYEEVCSYKVKATKWYSVAPDYEIVSVKKLTRPKKKKRPRPPEADRPQGVFVLRKNVSELVLRRLFAKVAPMVAPLVLPATIGTTTPLDGVCYSCAL